MELPYNLIAKKANIIDAFNLSINCAHQITITNIERRNFEPKILFKKSLKRISPAMIANHLSLHRIVSLLVQVQNQTTYRFFKTQNM